MVILITSANVTTAITIEPLVVVTTVTIEIVIEIDEWIKEGNSLTKEKYIIKESFQ